MQVLGNAHPWSSETRHVGAQSTRWGTCLCCGRQSTLAPAVGSRPSLPERREVESGPAHSVPQLLWSPILFFSPGDPGRHTGGAPKPRGAMPLGDSFPKLRAKPSGSEHAQQAPEWPHTAGLGATPWKGWAGHPAAAWTLLLVGRPCPPLESESCRHSEL